jgi:hypothetical protein
MTVPRSVKEIIEQAEELAERFERFDPPASRRAVARSLAAVHRAAVARAHSEARLADAVSKARADGHSWASIGTLLGTSGEAARQRYGSTRDPKPKAI